MMRDRLQIQFMAPDLCVCKRSEFGETAIVVNVGVGQKDVSQVRGVKPRLFQTVQKIFMGNIRVMLS